jgi:RNA polymerase sigma factor (sigma-70 family)
VSVSLSVDGPGDAELISAVRGGDVDAYGELFARHVESARRLARQLAGPGDADDLVSDAFTKVLTVLQRGGGPDLAFRAYLLTAVRRLHVDRIRAGSRLRPVDDLAPFDAGLPFHDTAVEGFDNAAAARAFASLPERWQMVLWHTEVEQQKPADIAPLLGMSANSVSALAYRAREGLRQAFLSQHASDPDDVDCAWTRDHLGAYVRGGLSRRDAARVDHHLAACRACAAVYLELTEVNSGLAGLLAPLLLGSAGAGYLSSTGVGSSVISGGFAAAKTWAASHAAMTAVGGMVVTASAVLTIYGASQLPDHGQAKLGSPPAASHAPVAPSLPTTGGELSTSGPGPGDHPSRTARRGVVPPAPSPSATPTATPSVSDQTEAAIVSPTAPSSQPTGPSAGTTEPAGPLTFDSTPPTHPAIGSTYQVSARGGSGRPITFSVDGATTHAACSIAGTTVTFDHAGTCVIAAEESGGPAPKAGRAARATQSIDVPQTAQTVEFTSQPPGNPVVEGTYDVGVTSTSGRWVTLTTNHACSVSGSTVTFVHADDCVVTATQAGDADLASASATQTLTVGRAVQTIQLSPAPAATVSVGDSTSVSGGASGNPVEITSAPTETCTLVGSTVFFVNPGDCQIDAHQDGNADYSAADYATVVKVVGPTADLTVTAEITGAAQNATQIRATVGNLPQGTQALLTVAPEGNYALKPVGDGGACNKTGPASYECMVTPGSPAIDFDVNVHQGTVRFVDFLVTPVEPLTDTDPTNNSFRLALDG